MRYYEPDGDHVINVFKTHYVHANVSWDSIDGWFGPGASVQYTVTTAGSAPKAVVAALPGPMVGWTSWAATAM